MHPMHKNQPPPSGFINRSSSITSTTPLAPEQWHARQKYFDDLKKTTTCYNCGKQGYWQSKCLQLAKTERLELRGQKRFKSQIAAPSSQSFPAIETSPDLVDGNVTYV